MVLLHPFFIVDQYFTLHESFNFIFYLYSGMILTFIFNGAVSVRLFFLLKSRFWINLLPLTWILYTFSKSQWEEAISWGCSLNTELDRRRGHHQSPFCRNKKRHAEHTSKNLQQRLMYCFICSNLDSRSRFLSLWLCEHSSSYCNLLAWK